MRRASFAFVICVYAILALAPLAADGRGWAWPGLLAAFCVLGLIKTTELNLPRLCDPDGLADPFEGRLDDNQVARRWRNRLAVIAVLVGQLTWTIVSIAGPMPPAFVHLAACALIGALLTWRMRALHAGVTRNLLG